MNLEVASSESFLENLNETAPALSRRGLKKHKTNPFLPNAAENTNEGFKRKNLKSADGKQLMVMNASGENVGSAGFWHTQEVDKTHFVNLYVNGGEGVRLIERRRLKYSDLSMPNFRARRQGHL